MQRIRAASLGEEHTHEIVQAQAPAAAAADLDVHGQPQQRPIAVVVLLASEIGPLDATAGQDDGVVDAVTQGLPAARRPRLGRCGVEGEVVERLVLPPSVGR